MLIVYQSLESSRAKSDTGATVFGGKLKPTTQGNASKVYPMGANRTVTYQHPVFDSNSNTISYENKQIEFATEEESRTLLKKYKENEDDKELIAFLEGAIKTIKLSTMNRTKSSSGFISARLPDVIVLGEVYGADLQGKVIEGYEVCDGMNPNGESCNRFMVLKNAYTTEPLGIKVYYYDQIVSTNKNENAICMVLKVQGWLMAFVHTPNAIADDSSGVVKYLENNVLRATSEKKLDLLVGDTNQPRPGFVEQSLQNKLGGEDWTSSIHNRKQEVVGFGGHDTFLISGTNSGFDKHFDIACTRHSAAIIQDEQVVGLDASVTSFDPVFLFHGLTDKFTELNGKAYAYTDHNGVIVEVLRAKQTSYKRTMCSVCGKSWRLARKRLQGSTAFVPVLPRMSVLDLIDRGWRGGGFDCRLHIGLERAGGPASSFGIATLAHCVARSAVGTCAHADSASGAAGRRRSSDRPGWPLDCRSHNRSGQALHSAHGVDASTRWNSDGIVLQQ